MALSATVDIEIRSTGSDNNGGGYNIAAGGTDYSQQDSEHVFIDGTVITGVIQATTTDILIVGYTVLATDVGNIMQVTGGTATAGFYQIASVNTGTNTWTMDKSVGTAAQTTIGRMGGGLATIGKAGTIPYVAGNRFWVKYHLTNVYTSTSATANVANGRISLATAGTNVAVVIFRGYETTHGDFTGNRPTIRWGVNAASVGILASSAGFHSFENLILDGNRGSFTLTRGITLTGANSRVAHCKFMGFSATAITRATTAGSPTQVFDCEFTDCVTSACLSLAVADVTFVDFCNFHDNAIESIVCSSATTRLYVCRSIFDTSSSSARFINWAAGAVAGGLRVNECVFYNAAGSAIFLGVSIQAEISNCIFETNALWGIDFNAATSYNAAYLTNNAFYNNASGAYDTTKIYTFNVQGIITNTTGTFFVDAPNQNFALNSTANQGALARAAAFPSTYKGTITNNFLDVGAAQHQDSGGATTNIFNVME